MMQFAATIPVKNVSKSVGRFKCSQIGIDLI